MSAQLYDLAAARTARVRQRSDLPESWAPSIVVLAVVGFWLWLFRWWLA